MSENQLHCAQCNKPIPGWYVFSWIHCEDCGPNKKDDVSEEEEEDRE